jgi:hypothetical protein
MHRLLGRANIPHVQGRDASRSGQSSESTRQSSFTNGVTQPNSEGGFLYEAVPLDANART